MESVCEIATSPCTGVAEAGAQLRGLRRTVQAVASELGLAVGSAGTHPFALWEEQRIVSRPRYRELVAGLQFVARQEIIFGIHVHVGLDDPDKAIHVTNGMRVHLPLLLALSANSPVLAGAGHRPAVQPHARSSAPSRAWASRPATTTSRTGRAGCSSWSTAAWCPTTPTSGTTSARTRASARWRSA